MWPILQPPAPSRLPSLGEVCTGLGMQASCATGGPPVQPPASGLTGAARPPALRAAARLRRTACLSSRSWQERRLPTKYWRGWKKPHCQTEEGGGRGAERCGRQRRAGAAHVRGQPYGIPLRSGGFASCAALPGSPPPHLLAEAAVHALDDDAGGIAVLPADPIALRGGSVGYGARRDL